MVKFEHDVLSPQVNAHRHHLYPNEGWLYLDVVLDLFSHLVIGWSMKSQMTSDAAN